jgi:hypothetical protein
LDTVEVVMAIEEVRVVIGSTWQHGLMNITGVQHRDSRQGSGCDSQWYVVRWHREEEQKANNDKVGQAVEYIMKQPDGKDAAHTSIFPQ